MVNTLRHLVVANLMAPLEQTGIKWSVGKVCQAAKIKRGILEFLVFPNFWACYSYILGKCKKKCATNCDHVNKEELPDAMAEELCNMLAPGVAALYAGGGASSTSPPKKKKKQR